MTLDAHTGLLLRIEAALETQLDTHLDVDGAAAPTRLVEAMRYSLLAGGKRLRPLLVLLAARASWSHDDDEQAVARALPAAVAIEMVHTYSLIHDDLPAMDDDDLRRGRPTLHKATDEATAILAGDALLTDAFSVVARAERRAADQVLELARAAGSAGMCGGQLDDLENEGKPVDAATLERIHKAKTGRLIVAACALGGLAVDARDDVIERLRRYGAHTGFAFQIADDVLDVIGDVEKGGKVRGRDEKHDKATYVRLHGVDGAKQLALDEAERAIEALGPLGARAKPLIDIARFAASRTH